MGKYNETLKVHHIWMKIKMFINIERSIIMNKIKRFLNNSGLSLDKYNLAISLMLIL